MAHLFGPKRIREKEGRGAHPLVMQPTDQNTKQDFIRVFGQWWKKLTLEDKSLARPKWAIELTEALMKCDPMDWMDKFRSYYREIKSERFHQPGRKNPKPMKHFRTEKRADLASVFEQYNLKRAKKIAVAFPYWLAKEDETLELVKYILENGFVWDLGKRAYCDIYLRYQEELSVAAKANLNRRVRQVQSLLFTAKVWLAYFQETLQIVDIRAVKAEDFEEFEGWRLGYRGKGTDAKPITRSIIRKDICFVQNVFDYAVEQKIIRINPTNSIQLNTSHLCGPDGEKIDTETKEPMPYTLPVLSDLLKKLHAHCLSRPYRNVADIRRRDGVRLNLLSCIFCLVTGCRPKEINEWQVINGQLGFRGGKTKNAKRNLILTPTLQKVISDPQFLENKKYGRIAKRISNFLQKTFGKEYTSYRFRHTTATMLLVIGEKSPPEIAYFLGHASSVITENVYGAMKVYLSTNGSQDAKVFWEWINTKYFDDFPLYPYGSIPVAPIIATEPIVLPEFGEEAIDEDDPFEDFSLEDV